MNNWVDDTLDLLFESETRKVPRPGQVCAEEADKGKKGWHFWGLAKVNDVRMVFVQWDWEPGNRWCPKIYPVGSGDTTFRVQPWAFSGLSIKTGLTLRNVPANLACMWREALRR